jgi:protein MpaA
VVPTPTPSPTPASAAGVVGSQIIGVSANGVPLVVYQLGAGARSVLVVGGIDGGTESNTTALVDQLLEYLPEAPDVLHAGFVLELLPAANPDGLASGSRWLADGVDANRNWPTDDWSPDTYVAGPTLITGGGGPFPWSEPETRALAAFVQRTRPTLVVSYHSAAALVMAGPAARALGLDQLYASITGYAWGDWTAYPVTGDFAQWSEDQGIPTVEVELPDHATTDFEANFSAFQALIDSMGLRVPPSARQARSPSA